MFPEKEDVHPFVLTYRKIFENVYHMMCEQHPDYIVAIARKGPRLFDLFLGNRVITHKPIIVSDRAIPFLQHTKNKNIPLFDDVVIFGSTMNDKLEEIKFLGANPLPYSLAYNVEGAVIKARYGKALEKREVASFCDDIVGAFQLIGKPYDIDHPIFSLASVFNDRFKIIEQNIKNKKCVEYHINLTTELQDKNGILNLVYGYRPPFTLESLLNAKFCKFNQSKLYKIRLIYNKRKKTILIAPIFNFYLSLREKSEESTIFTQNMDYLNEIIYRTKDTLSGNFEHGKIEEVLCRVIFYLVEYLYGLCFIYSLNVFPDEVTLNREDIYYLYGDMFGEYLLKVLEEERKKDIQEILSEHISHSPQSVIKIEEINNLALFQELFSDTTYLRMKLVRETLEWSNEIASVWNICRLMRVIDDKTRIPETLSKPGRLNFGFTFEDILSILKMKIGISDPEILSTVIDYFGDRGVVTPIILKYPTNYWVNAYRFGENLHGYPEQKRAYFVRAALERLFNNLKIRDISQFDFEKFIVFLIQAFQKFDWKEVKEFNWGKAFDEFGARPITDGFRSLLMKDGQALTEKRYLFKESQDNKVIKVINNRITLNEAFYTIRPPESNPLSTVIPKIYLYTDLWTELVYNQQIWPRKDELMLLLTTCDNKYNFLNSYMVGLYSWFYHDYSRFSKVLAETKIILDLRDKNPEECATKIDEIDKSLIHEIATRLIQCENKRELWEKRNEIIRKLDKELTEKTFIGPLWNEVKNKLIDLSPFNEDEQFVFNYLQTFYNICRASINILRSVLKEREKGESEKYMQQYNTAVEDAKFIPGLLKVSKNDLGEVTKVLEHNFPILLQFFEKSVKKGKYQTVNLMDEIKDAYLRRAIDLAKLCESENGKIRPKVGAIIVKNGEIIAEAYRNQDGKGSHAEAIAIKQCRGEDLEGAILVTTMEPCTEGDCRLEDVRLPCAALIAHYNIKGVVYGMLDPNKSIRGEGINFLRHVYKIPVIQFPDSLVKEIEDLNSGYISSVYKEQGTPKPKF